MRKVFLALTLLALACKHPGSAKLEGRWRGTRAEGVPPEMQATASSFAMGTEIIARGNQISVTTPGAKPQQAAYVVDEETKTALVIHTDRDGASVRESFIFSEDGKTMTWRVGEGRSLVFQKQKD